MLSQQEGELLTKVGPGTPIGDLMRRYWQPFLVSRDLPEPDGPPVRVKLLGEELVSFRDSDGKVGLVQERCPHRGASLFFGINQERGLMCIYHGWKFDVEGRCVDMPSDLPGSTFKDKVHVGSYPCLESGGAIWAYLGPPEHLPLLPDFGFQNLAPENVFAIRVPVYCSYLQLIEGQYDSTHLGTLHVNYDDLIPAGLESDVPGKRSAALSRYLVAKYRYAKVEVQDTRYGFRLIAVRPTDSGNQHVRIAPYVMPTIRVRPSPGGNGVNITVPADDHSCIKIDIQYRTGTPISVGERQQLESVSKLMEPDGKKRLNRADNDWNIDRWAQKHTNIAGIWPFSDQDHAVVESMGTIVDRSKEHLSSTDAGVIRLRQLLAKAARDVREGADPPGLDATIPFDKIRCEDIVIGPNEDPWSLAADAGESAGPGERMH